MQSAINTTDTKADAYRSLSVGALKKQADQVFDIVQRRASEQPDGTLTGKEIQFYFERDYGYRIESGSISRCVGGLVTAKRLVRMQCPRACSISGKPVLPVAMAQSQLRIL